MTSSSSRWRALARPPLLVLLALALLLPAFVAAPARAAAASPAAAAAAAPSAITEGTVVWGVRASFRQYIGAGGITVGDGLTTNDDGEFVFDVSGGSYDADSKRLQLDLVGSVHFEAHEGALDMTFRNLELVLEGERPAILADVTSRALTGELVDFGHVPVVDIPFEGKAPQLAGGRTVWTGLPSVLTEETAPAFAGFYQAGSSMDTIDIDYAGPGGVPVYTAENVVASGAPMYEPAGAIEGLASVSNVVADTARGVLHVQHVPAGENAAVLQAYDYTTLAPLPTPTVPAANQAYPGMVLDPGNGVVLMAQGSTLAGYRYDAQAGYTPITVDTTVGTVVEIGYDAPRDRVLVLGTSGLAVLTHDAAEPTGYAVTAYTGLSFSDRESVAGVSATAVIATAASARKGARYIRLMASDKTLVATPIPGVADEKANQPGQFDQPTMAFRDNTGIWLSAYTGSKIRVAAVDGAYRATGPWLRASVGSFLADRKEHVTNTAIMLDFSGRRVRVWKDDGWADINVPNLGSGSFFNNLGGDIGTDQTVFVASTTDDDRRVLRFRLKGIAPTATTAPADATVQLDEGVVRKDVTLTSELTDADSLRWQTRLGSTGKFADVPGATGPSLTWPATSDDNGRQFRVLATNEHATATSPTATLSVEFFPRVAAQPDDVATAPGDDALFKVMPAGNPYPSITWQRRVGGLWQSIGADDESVVVDGGFLTLRDTTADQAGLKVRAKLTNALGTTYSRVATLDVAEPSTVKRAIDGGTLTWGVKKSFRDYLAGPIAHGTVSLDGGVTQNADGTFAFPVTGGWSDPAAGTAEVRMGGTVRFTGHDGPPTCAVEHSPCLALRISDPVLRVDGDRGVLVADVESKDETTHQVVAYPAVELASFDAGDWTTGKDRVTARALPATLTASGAAAFAGFYAAGAELDPITLDGELGAEISEPVDVATTTTVALAGAKVAYGRAPVATVRVTGADGAPVAGRVTLTVGGRSVSAALAGGRAQVTLPANLRPGSLQVAARYDGADGVLASSAATTLTVTRARPVVTARPAKKKVRPSARAVVRVTARIPGASGVPATGQVVVRERGKVIAVATLRKDASGKVAVRLPRLKRGVHHLRVELLGSAVQLPSASGYVRLVVRR
ncbi:HtaA domain-containing protein [Pimelobacter simplex]|uniref:HtaA domain-containing protein n=1 Tax=Nocardioides simplex TaxID=2045 RepID=UPI003814B313